ncbi:MAG: FliH/SctL family protein [Lachnospiraceae bacterium]
MLSNLIKSTSVVVRTERERIIDSNILVAERIQTLSAVLEEAARESFAPEFTAGLNADQVEQILDNPKEQEADENAAGEMLRQAKEEAERILNAAREGADSILIEAKAEADVQKAEAVQAGHGEGYQAGYDEGLKKAEKAEAACKEKEQKLTALYEKKLEELEPQFIDTMTGIYEHVFHVDLSEKKELILYLLKDTMRNIEGGKNFFAHVSKDDYVFVNEQKQELLEGLGSSVFLEVIEDLTLPASHCFIEAESGIFDCGLGTELELLKKELKLLSYTKE